MRTYSEGYLTQVTGSARQFDFYVLVYGNAAEPDMLTADKIISINISRSSSDGIQLGACMSDRLSLRTLATSLFGGRGKKVEVYKRCTAPATEWVKMGTFYVDSSYTEHGMTTVKAYDNMSRMDKVVKWEDTSYVAAPVFPCTMQEVLEYVCARAKTTTDFQCQGFAVNKAPDGYTARELISYIAACHGGNARFSPNEVLQIRPYTRTNKLIDRNRCYSMDAAGDGGYTVKGILFDLGGDTKIFIDGDSNEYDPESDGVIECYNPFASVAVAEYAWSRLGGMNYCSCSLEMPAEDILEPGDVFTTEDSQGDVINVVVMEQELSVSHNGGFVERISCAGEGKSNQRSANNRMSSTESQVSAYTSTSPLSEYEYLSDTSVKANGITYTAEKDEAGLISKISDDSGNAIEPTVNGDITDIAFHNAVLMAVAIARGLGATLSLITTGFVGLFVPEGIDIPNSLWHNKITSQNDITLNGGSSDGTALHLAIGEYGSLSTDIEPNTVYIVCSSQWEGLQEIYKPIITKCLSVDKIDYGFDLFAFNKGGAVDTFCFSAIENDLFSAVSSNNVHVVCYTRSGNTTYLYIDGMLIGRQIDTYYGNYGGRMLLNTISRGGTYNPEDNTIGDITVRALAVGTDYHDAATVRNNMEYLAKMYTSGTSADEYVDIPQVWGFVGDPGITRLELGDKWLVTPKLTIEICATYSAIINTEVNKARFFDAATTSADGDAAFAFSLYGELFEYAIGGVWTAEKNSGLSIAQDDTNTISLVISGDTQQLYCNGVLISTGTNNLASIVGEYIRYVCVRSSRVMNRELDGTIYAMRVYNTALTAAEVAQNYAADKARYF